MARGNALFHSGIAMRLFVAASFLALGACATVPATPPKVAPSGPVEVQLLAFNDFHGNLEPPQQVVASDHGAVPAGGAAYLASALKSLRTPNSVTVAAGDLIGATPISSALFLDEPAIKALSLAGLDLAAVGNHEFDRGSAELLRMQKGGCEKFTKRVPCAVEPFEGAGFQYLAANVLTEGGTPLLPATAIREVGGVKIGFIGLTLKETATLVAPTGVAGLRFADEAATANALVPGLKAAGAASVVLLIHQGASTAGRYDDPACPGLAGDVLPIIERLDPAISVVVSGHTHNAYLCRLPIAGGGERLLTSAGKYGTMVTDIRMTFDRDSQTLTGARGDFVIVQGEPFANARLTAPLVPAVRTFAPDPQVAALVARYREAASGAANRPVGTLRGSLAKGEGLAESTAADFIADSQWFIARDPARGAADLALMNNGGARTDLTPAADGTVTFGQIFAMQPYANNIVTKSYTGAELVAVLEQMFDSGTNTLAKPNLMMPSANVRIRFDRSRPAGQRIVGVTIDGRQLDPKRTYRVAINNYLASGGDNFSKLAAGRDPVDGGLDLDATEAYLATAPKAPGGGRLIDLTPAGWRPAN